MLNFYDGQQKIGQNRCLEVPWWRSLEVEQFIFEERLLMVRDYISHVSSLAGSGCTWNYLWSVKLMICHNFWLKIGLDPKLWCWYHLFSPPTLILVPTSRGDVRRGYGCLRFRLSHSFCQGTPSGKGGWQFCVCPYRGRACDTHGHTCPVGGTGQELRLVTKSHIQCNPAVERVHNGLSKIARKRASC